MTPEIKEWLLRTPIGHEAAHRMAAPNKSLVLFKGQMSLRLQGRETETTKGRILFKWLPTPSARFEIDHLPVTHPISLEDAELRVPYLRLACPVSILQSTWPAGLCAGRINDRQAPTGISADVLVFHLPNFHDYIGESIRNSEATAVWKGRLLLKHESWVVTIDSVRAATTLRKTLTADGGYAITHVGSVRLDSSRPFPLVDALDLLDGLYYFLSFTRGIWCGPVLPVAFESGTKVWSRWAPQRIRPWQERRSWFPDHEYSQAESLCTAFSGFLDLWAKATWKEPLKNAIHLYIEANMDAGGVEGGIVLVQTALELLSWVYLVEDRASKVTSARKFDDRVAEGRIRDLLKTLSIPTDLPDDLVDLASAAIVLGTSDGVDTFVSLRNAIVHPKRSKRDKVTAIGTAARIQALSLGLWYLELILLRLFRYGGVYYSRLRSGYREDVREPVPWK